MSKKQERRGRRGGEVFGLLEFIPEMSGRRK
jgi:hypothetical protein